MVNLLIFLFVIWAIFSAISFPLSAALTVCHDFVTLFYLYFYNSNK